MFADGGQSFVLKGGHGALARTLDARTTRDIDLSTNSKSVKEALTELRRLAQRDLGDFVSFEYAGATEIKSNDEYRSGLTVKFVPKIGNKRVQTISVDLVVDEIASDGADLVSPVDRIDVKGLPVCDYLVYPVEAAIADKFCALSERHDGRASSRVKDLVDIVVYSLTANIDGSKLEKRIKREISARGLDGLYSFSLPTEWGEPHARQYAKLCSQTGIPERFHDMETACELAAELIDPVLSGRCETSYWDSASMTWSPKREDIQSLDEIMASIDEEMGVPEDDNPKIEKPEQER